MTSNEFMFPECDCCNIDSDITIYTEDGPIKYSPVCFKLRQKLAKKKQIEKYATKVKDVLEELNKK